MKEPPLKYRGYLIAPDKCDYSPWKWEYAHGDYDGSPDEPIDNREGLCGTLEECIDQIDEMEDNQQPETNRL